MSTTTNLRFTLTSPGGGSSDDEEQGGGGSDDQNNNQNPSGGGSSNNQNTNGSSSNVYYDTSGEAVPNTSAGVTDNTTYYPNTGVNSISAENVRGTIFAAVFFSVVVAGLIGLILFRSKRKKAIVFAESPFHISSRRRTLTASALVLAFATLSGLAISSLYASQEKLTQAAESKELKVTAKSELTFEVARGQASVVKDNVVVELGNATDFDLYVTTDNNKFCIKNTADCLKPVSGDFATSELSAIATNKWGISLSGKDTTEKIWGAVPTESTKLSHSGTSTTVYYGINPGNNLPDGEYIASVTYKAIAKEAPAPEPEPEPEPEPTTAYMQDFDPSASLPNIGTSTTLVDKRDGKSYTVKRLADGNVWMMENLAISNVKMTLSDTNLAEDATFDLTTDVAQSTSTGWCAENTAECTNLKAVYIDNDNGGYYNWYTATAGNGAYETGEDGTDVGYDICPKGWHLPVGGGATSTANQFALLDRALNSEQDSTAGTNRNNETDGIDLAALQASYDSLVSIFPLAGRIHGSLDSVGLDSDYWSSTAHTNEFAYRLGLYSNDLGVYPRDFKSKFVGSPIRCIASEDRTAYMQTTNISELAEGEIATLTDARDNQEYTVYRWPSTGTAGTDYPTGLAGAAIMTKDLSLGYVTGGSVTKGADLTLTTDDSAAAATITARTGTSDWSGTSDDANQQYINGPQSGQENYSSHSYYSYGAAQAVCPKGWRPPTNAEYGNIATFMGGDNSTGSSTIISAPYNFVYGGMFMYSTGWDSVGSYGLYWSSTQDSSTSGYSLRFYSSSLTTGSDIKSFGRSVRCIASPSGP